MNRSILNFIYIFSSLIYVFMTTSCTNNEKQPLGIFQKQKDIGNPAMKGKSLYNPATGEYKITGGGENIWFDQDEFHFLFREIRGDFILRAHVAFEGEGVNKHRKLGIMLRDSTTPDAKHVSAVVHGDGLTSLQYRQEKSGNTTEEKAGITYPDIIQLQRKGDQYIFSYAREGDTFQKIELPELAISETAGVGLFVCAHEPNGRESATFHNVRLVFPADDDFIPYQDYIGSNLEILDMETGKRQIKYNSPLSLQAPNWSPDGNKLIYNSVGKIFSFHLPTSEITEINTGFALNNNNDHVLSFDGKFMGISDHTEHEDHQSLIYIIPSEGGTPQLITPEGPSYLHGFSPDGEFLVYTAGRNNFTHLDIYKISRFTKEEVRITNALGLDDGSEYSPDGKYIYFNSDRTGTMQIWRMKPDGGEQEQLTFDEYNDWFPHISPDSKKMVFLSYESDINSSDHPFYKQVYIRQMPVEGGKPKVVAYLYGGQGSMNVFNWSPDSKKIAFVSNTK